MKTKFTLITIMLFGLLFTNCSKEETPIIETKKLTL